MRDFQESITLIRDAFVLDRAFEALKGLIERSVDLGMELGHLSEQTGIGVQNLSVLKYTSEQTGIAFETLTKGFKKLSTSIFEWQHGEKLAGEAFLDLGISAEDVKAKGEDMYGMLDIVAEKFKTMPDGPHKLAVAVELFGRSGAQLIPVLNQGAAGLEEFKAEAQSLGLVLDESAVKKMEKLHSEFVKIKGAIEGGSLAFATALAPALEGIITEFMSATKGTNIWAEAGKQTGLVAIEIATAVKKAADEVRELKDEFLNTTAAMDAPYWGLRAKTDWTKESRDTAQAKHDQLMQQLHDSKVDHDAIAGEEAHWVKTMKALEEQLLHPAKDTEGSDKHGHPTGEWAPIDEKKVTGKTEMPAFHSPALAEYLARQKQNAKDDAKAAEQEMKDLDKLVEDWKIKESEQMEKLSVKAPNVLLAKQPLFDMTKVEGEAEKFAHGVFDPLFDLGGKWDEKWKQIRDNMLRDFGQLMESKLFDLLFGDPQGRGGQGWNGTSWQGDTTNPRAGLQSNAGGVVGGLLDRFLHRGAAVTSNGGLGAGAGTAPSAAASLMQVGKSAAGGIQVVLNNNGSPLQVDQTQHQNDGGEGQVIQIMLKQLETNGPIAQGIMGLMGAL